MRPGARVTIATPGADTVIGTVKEVSFDRESFDGSDYHGPSAGVEMTVVLDHEPRPKRTKKKLPGVTVTVNNKPLGTFVERDEELLMYPRTILNYHRTSRTVDIHIEVKENVFLGPDDQEIEREIGKEMPLYDSMPAERLVPLLNAARSQLPELIDLARDSFRIP